MLKAAVLVLVLANAAWRERVVRVDEIEANHFVGSTRLIVWEYHGSEHWPVDWVVSPKGYFDGEKWWDENGAVVWPRNLRETWTSFDPERRAYSWHVKNGTSRAQCGVWHETQTASP